MPQKIFVNLPVKDLKRSVDFFRQLGFSFEPKFTNDDAACMIINDGSIYAMLLTEPFFRNFTKKKISDATETTEVLLALEIESKDKVNEMVQKAVAAGGSTYADPVEQDWMYQHSFADPDGHQWELAYMDESKMPENPSAEEVNFS